MITTSAWDVACDWEMNQKFDFGWRVRLANGRTLYEGAYVTRNQQVCLQRLERVGDRFREVRRYVPYSAAVVLEQAL